MSDNHSQGTLWREALEALMICAEQVTDEDGNIYPHAVDALAKGCRALQAPLSSPQSDWSVRTAAELVVSTFEKDFAQGYKTRDKEFAVDILKTALRHSPVEVINVEQIVAECHAAAYNAYSQITPQKYVLEGPAGIAGAMLRAINAVARERSPAASNTERQDG